MRIVKMLILILLGLLPLGELIRFDIGHDIAIKPFDVVCIVLFATWLATLRINKKKGKQQFPQYIKIASIFPVIGLISLAVNSIWLKPLELLVASFYLIRWTAFASVFVIIAQLDKKFKKIVYWFLLIDGLVFLLVGYAQYFLYSNLKNLYYLGWDEHMYRLFSTFFDPNFTGAFLVLYAIFISGLIWSEMNKKKFKMATFLSSILVATILAIFLTYSRSALLMLITGVFVLSICINKKKIFFILLGLISIFAVIAAPRFHVENVNLLRVNSAMARLGSYSDAVHIIQDHFILGTGFDSYRYAKHLYGLGWSAPNVPSHADAGVDNSYLFVLATTGIVGFSAYLWIWVFLVKRTIYHYKKHVTIFPLIALVSCISLFVNAFFINSLFYPAIMLWVWLLLGITFDDNIQ